MIVVLINDTVKKHLLKQPEKSRKKIRERFEFLESGIWDSGLKVKKLKGISSKYVFEARLDKANRILFTLGHNKNTGGEHTLIVYIWGIAAHDEVSQKSRSIIPVNAPFLQFRHYDEALLENIDMEELAPAYFTQENISEKVLDESGSQKWYPVDEPEWQRIQLYKRDDFELFLYLTPEQQEVLKTPLPLMVSGTAGSGKTTLSVYYLLNKNFNDKKKLFITYNNYLKEFARKLYHGLLNEQEWKHEAIPPDFYTFKDLCLEILGKKHPPENEVDFERFSRFFASYPGHHSFDPALVWEEIRSILKGAVSRVDLHLLEKAKQDIANNLIKSSLIQHLQSQFLLFSRLESLQVVDKFVQKYLKTNIQSFAAKIEKYVHTDIPREREALVSLLDRTITALKKQEPKDGKKYLSYFEYESLGKKKAPNFQFNRKEIYRIFEWYQARLEKENLWDELDLVPESVPDRYIYDILACDEIQDFTDTQLDLLFNLVKNPNNMFLAGDTRQTINPSGFRWEEVRRHFYERGLTVPELKMLSLNFRSSGSIVELSNILLEIKGKLTGKKAEESREEWKYKGRPVTVVSGIRRGDMLEILKEAGARRTILVRNEAEKEKLKKHLETELVFTIKEAKGLEFDTVVLWKFCDDQTTEDVWKVILDISTRSIHEAKIKHEINLLYVGITRSQKDMIVYDGFKPSLIWKSEQISNHVYITDDRSFIQGIWDVVSTPEEWVEQGNYFFERGYFRAAAECFKNGGDEMRLARARAYYYEKTGDFKEAAVNFEKIAEIEKAARYYEKAGDYKKALPLWETLHDKERALLCLAAVLKEEGKFRQAGQLYLEKKKYHEAAACFQQSKNYKQLADLFRKHLKNIKEAARCYELAGEYETAAALYARLKSYENAAHLYEKGKNYPKAETAWKKAKNTRRLLDLYQKTGQDEKLFLIYERQKEFDKAVKYLKALNRDKDRLTQEARALLEKRKYFKALIRFYAAGEAKGIGDTYIKMKKYREAIPHLEAAGDMYSAAGVYYKIKDYKKSFMLFLNSGEDRENNYALARKTLQRIRDREFKRDLALDHYNKNDYERAAVVFSRLGGHWDKKGICYIMAGDKEKAFEMWKSCDSPAQFAEIAHECMDKNLVETGAEFFFTYMNINSPYKPLLPRRYKTFSEDDGFENKSPLVELMDTYFKSNPGIDRMRTWGEYIARHDFSFNYQQEVLFYLEKTRQYNALIAYFKTREIFYIENLVERKVDFKRELQELKAADGVSAEVLALRYLILGRTHELNQILPDVTLTRYNFCLGLWGDKVFRLRSFDYCVRHGLSESLISALIPIRGDILLAEYFEYTGAFSEAGRYYDFAGRYPEAAKLFEKAEDYGNAGDCYYKLKDYELALTMYKKQTTPDNRKIAGAYEQLKDFESALIYWNKLGDQKSIRKCMKKIEQQIEKKKRMRRGKN